MFSSSGSPIINNISSWSWLASVAPPSVPSPVPVPGVGLVPALAVSVASNPSIIETAAVAVAVVARLVNEVSVSPLLPDPIPLAVGLSVAVAVMPVLVPLPLSSPRSVAGLRLRLRLGLFSADAATMVVVVSVVKLSPSSPDAWVGAEKVGEGQERLPDLVPPARAGLVIGTETVAAVAVAVAGVAAEVV